MFNVNIGLINQSISMITCGFATVFLATTMDFWGGNASKIDRPSESMVFYRFFGRMRGSRPCVSKISGFKFDGLND